MYTVVYLDLAICLHAEFSTRPELDLSVRQANLRTVHIANINEFDDRITLPT